MLLAPIKTRIRLLIFMIGLDFLEGNSDDRLGFVYEFG